MDKITKSLLDSFANLNELSAQDEWLQFEHFANFCILSKHYRNSFSIDAVHTGGGGDSAIDGIAIIVNGHLIEDIDELEEFVESSGYLDCDVVFVQSKTSSSFSGAEMGSFVSGVKDFLSDTPKFVQNDFIIDAKSIWDAVIEKSSLMHNRRPNCWLNYVTTGRKEDDQNLSAVISSGIKEILESGLFQDVSFDRLGADEIQRLYHETKNKLSTTISFQSKVTLPDIEDVTESYLGVLPYSEFLKLVQDEAGRAYNIFDDNVRDFLGDNRVNKKIERSLRDGKQDLFCILNNGVTIVATSLTPAGNRFTIRDYQIVNGCQTTNVLRSMVDLDGIEDVSVPVKIIVTKSDEIKNEVTIATNSQTEVKAEQMEALSQFQKKLELYYGSISDPVQLFYERRSKQFASNESVRKTQIVTIPMQIKAFAAAYLNVPHSVSGYYGTIVNKFGKKIFNNNHQLAPYYASALCHYRLETFFRNGQLSTEYKSLRYQLIMLARILAGGLAIDQLNSYAIEKAALEFCNRLAADVSALKLFRDGIQICKDAGLDLSKRQFKAESDTVALLAQVESAS